MSRMPEQRPPVARRALVHPHKTVDLDSGTLETRVRIRMELLHGANFNDPAHYQGHDFHRIMHSGAGHGD